MRILAIVTLLLVAGAGIPAWSQSPPPAFGRSEVIIATADGRRHVFQVEVATTPGQQSYGLMFRRRLAADAGMLFDYGDERPVSMWMKNTIIPLDMLFMRGDGQIVNIVERAVPGSLQPRSSDGRVRAVLEVNGGIVAKLGIKPGDRALHPIFGD